MRKYDNTDVKQVCLSFPNFREAVSRNSKVFSVDLEADQVAEITGLSRNAINKYFKAMRVRIAEFVRGKSHINGIELF